MGFFAYDEDQRDVATAPRMAVNDPDFETPTWFGGAGDAFMESGPLAAARMGLNAGELLLAGEEQLLKHSGFNVEPGQFVTPYHEWSDHLLKTASDYYRPRPNQVSKSGEILGGLAGGAFNIGLGGGNPAPLVSASVNQTQADLEAAGVSPLRATAGGLIAGALNYAGFKLPVLGSNIASRLATGAVGMTGLGVAGRAIENEVAAGHPEQQSEVLDPAAMTLDALMGTGFGLLTHVHAARSAAQVKAISESIANVLNAKHMGIDTAPALPLDAAAERTHVENVEAALHALIFDTPFEPVPLEGNFEPRGEPAVSPKQVDEVLAEHNEHPSGMPADDVEGLRSLARELEPGGGITYTTDERGQISGRTGSSNPDWFQRMVANKDTKMTVVQVMNAIDKLAAGKKLGVREQRVIDHMLGHLSDIETERSMDPELGEGQPLTDAEADRLFGSPEPAPQSEALKPEDTSEPVEMKAVRDAIETHGDAQIPVPDETREGEYKTVAASKLLEQADADLKEARNDAKSFEAAANCFIAGDQ